MSDPTHTPRPIRMTPVLAREFVDLVQVMLDQIDGDPRAVQFFDSRLIERCKVALQRVKGENPAQYGEVL